MVTTCQNCKSSVEQLNRVCKGCGYRIVPEPDEEIREHYLRTPALGAMLFTQGWAFGARLYVWFLLSLIPGVGFVALFACLFFGRRWAWKAGGWGSWEEFVERMRLLDTIAIAWIVILLVFYFFARS